MRAGEIVGIAGVAGNGQSELLEALAGIRRPAPAARRIAGKPIDSAARSTPAAVRAAGLAHVPEDRHRMRPGARLRGVGELRSSATRASRLRATASSSTIGAIRDHAATQIEKLRHPPARCDLQDRQLLRRQPAEDRHRPRDGARPRRAARRPADARRRHRRHRVHPPPDRRAARRGKAILLVSVELDEIRSLSDRILVMFDGRIVGERVPARPTSASSA